MVLAAGQKARTSDMGAGTLSLYSGTNTALGGSSWTQIPFATLAVGTGLGLTVASNTLFTLAAGLWEIDFSAVVDQTSHTGVTGAFFAIGTGNLNSGGSAFAQTNSPVNSGQVAGSLSAKVLSSGSTVINASIYPAGASTTISLAGALGVPRITFKQIAN